MRETYPQLLWSFWKLVKFGFLVFATGIIVGVAIDKIWYWTSWWQQLGMIIVNFHLANPWFFLIYGGFGTVAILYYHVEHKKRSEDKKRRKFLEEHVLPELKQNE